VNAPARPHDFTNQKIGLDHILRVFENMIPRIILEGEGKVVEDLRNLHYCILG
jgi:hypothetical protein